MGCGRSLAEIVQWGTAKDADKAAILARSRERLRARAASARGARLVGTRQPAVNRERCYRERLATNSSAGKPMSSRFKRISSPTTSPE